MTPIDEKPQGLAPDGLRRSRDISENPRVALLVDHYREEWSQLCWVQVRGTARRLSSRCEFHTSAVTALREKYAQYTDHTLEDRPMIQITPGSIRSCGQLEHPGETEH